MDGVIPTGTWHGSRLRFLLAWNPAVCLLTVRGLQIASASRVTTPHFSQSRVAPEECRVSCDHQQRGALGLAVCGWGGGCPNRAMGRHCRCPGESTTTPRQSPSFSLQSQCHFSIQANLASAIFFSCLQQLKIEFIFNKICCP